MALQPFNFGSVPNFDAVIINAVLLDALYHGRKDIVETYARESGATIVAYVVDPTTYPPDYCILRQGNDILIVVAGTTNKPQWTAHILASWIPSIDPVINRTILGSFQNGEALILPDISEKLGPRQDLTIRITGHSYGAAVAHIMAVHFRNSPIVPAAIQLMTFGEPKSFGGGVPNQDYFHARITTFSDAVIFTPPSCTFLLGIRKAISTGTILALSLRWKHYGQRWNFFLGKDSFFKEESTLPDILVLDLINSYFALGLSFAWTDQGHSLDEGYIPQILRLVDESGYSFERAMVAYARQLIQRPGVFENVSGPPLTAQELNQAWFAGENVVTPETIESFALVSALVQVQPFNSGESSMVVQLKGTVEFTQDIQGYSESVYAVPGLPRTPGNYRDMLSAVNGWLALRMQLSYGRDTTGCVNPVIPVAIRIEDENVSRDAVTSSIQVAVPGAPSINGITPRSPENQNANVDEAAKLSWQSGLSRQKAVTYLHGLPVGYFSAGVEGAPGTVARSTSLRESNPTSAWLQRLYNLCNYMNANALGYRFFNSPWDVDGAPGPNATPVSAVYNDNYSMYEIQMPPGATGANVHDRYVLRGWKQFPYMNGRWPGMLVPATIAPQTGTVIRILRKARKVNLVQPGFVSLERWNYFAPALAGPAAGVAIPGCTYYFITEKKVGRSFELQRGRARTRPT